MLKRLALRDFVIVTSLEVDLDAGFSVLTGETGAGKSILIDALQLALGSRGDAGVVCEGAARAEITAEFDTPPGLVPWLEEAGFDAGDTLLLRRTIDAQGKSRAWVNGSPATVAWVLTGIGVAIFALGLLQPKLVKPVFVGLMLVALPIGMVLATTVLGLLYYLLFTPVGLFFKLMGRDKLNRRLDPGATTYWFERKAVTPPARYLRMY